MERIIKKSIENMGSRERVERTFSYEKTDRVTIGYESNPVAHTRLCAALGIPEKDHTVLLKALGVDYMGFPIAYTGPQIYPDLPGRLRDPEFGAVMRRVKNEYGYYWDFCDFPLMGASDEEIAAYKLPDPDCYDYDGADASIDKALGEGFAVYAGGAGFGNIINKTGKLFGMEEALMDLYTQRGAAMELLDRRLAGTLRVMERVLERNKGKLSFIWMGEDLGTQHSPLIGVKMYRATLLPRHRRFIDLARSYNLPVLMHTCG
jgi:uroporphyrinogen decarboxylase